MIKCSKQDCQGIAVVQISISLAVNKDHPPAVSQPIVFLCEDHKNDYTKDDFFGPEQWPGICMGFEMNGLMAPTKEFSNIIREPIPELN